MKEQKETLVVNFDFENVHISWIDNTQDEICNVTSNPNHKKAYARA